MRSGLGQSWKQAMVVALLVIVDLAISLPIMGATYRPFSWMSIAPADAATLYPVIQNLTMRNGRPCLTVDLGPSEVTPPAPGDRSCILQRSTNLLDTGDWTDVVSTTTPERVFELIDTNPVSRAVFYRVVHILGGTP